VFRVNNVNASGGVAHTQFARALFELNIEGICAETSQAKGRVELSNLTLTDRLVKEMRLANRDTGFQPHVSHGAWLSMAPRWRRPSTVRVLPSAISGQGPRHSSQFRR
jgi:hypothetical protein